MATPPRRSRNYVIWAIVAAIAIGVAIFYFASLNNQPSQLDGFASCLKDRGAKFYGAFWCPHCQNQKRTFGSSERLLPYIECSTPDGTGQLPVCSDAGVESYPTWVYPDGSRETGEIPLQRLAEKTGCELPAGHY
jgi:hypothetical protein